MMIGVPYNPIIGEMSVDGRDDATRPGVTWGCGRSPDGQSAPDPARKADKFLSLFAPSRTVTRAQSPTACSQHAMPIHPGLTSTAARCRPRAAETVGVIFRHAVRPSFYTVPAPAIVLSDGRGHEATRTHSAVVHPG
jgi:hypothetical protein